MLAPRPEWSFERFVPTASTREAFEQAAAFATTEPAGAPRALLLFGPPGVGKSHLLRSIVRVVLARGSSQRVVHVTAAEFVQRLIDRMRTERAAWACPTHPPLDLLAVDDLHVLRNRPAAQSEVAAAFKGVVASGGRVACAAGCSPAEIPCLASPLRGLPRSRLVELRRPRHAAMQRIVASLASSEALEVTPSALRTMAGACHGDVRRAIGAIARRRFEREATGR